MDCPGVNVEAISGGLGAEITGLDLSAPTDEQFGFLHQTLLDSLVVVIRDQSLSPAQHLALGRRFGSLNTHEFVRGLPEHPEIIEVIKEADESGYNFGGTWHSDISFLPEPSMASLLYAKEVPARGGDTLFANMYRAYETLSARMQNLLAKLNGVHSPKEIYSASSSRSDRRAGRSRSMTMVNQERAYGETVHPVVRTHPETGRKLLYVNPNFTVRFEGMTAKESQSLLTFLFEHQRKPEFICRVSWAPDTLTIWDNRCTQHLAINDYDGFRRRMHRVTVNGDRPF